MTIDRQKILDSLTKIIMPGSSEDIVKAAGITQLDIQGDNVNIKAVVFSPSLNIRRKTENQIQYLISNIYPQAKISIEVSSQKPSEGNIPPVETSISQVKHIIAISSGKGGVGKSTITANLAVALSRKGYKVGLVDADIYGPSMPIMFDVEGALPVAVEHKGKDMMSPIEAHGIKLQSIGFFAKDGQAMAWRGAMATKALQQMIFETKWDELDFMLIDLPPGTGDIHLTLTGILPLTGAIVVTTPQSVAVSDVARGIELFANPNINVPVMGVVENMAYFTPEELPDNKYYIFGRDGGKMLAKDHNVPFLAEIPIVESIRLSGDVGSPVALMGDTLLGKTFDELAEKVVGFCEQFAQ